MITYLDFKPTSQIEFVNGRAASLNRVFNRITIWVEQNKVQIINIQTLDEETKFGNVQYIRVYYHTQPEQKDLISLG